MRVISNNIFFVGKLSEVWAFRAQCGWIPLYELMFTTLKSVKVLCCIMRMIYILQKMLQYLLTVQCRVCSAVNKKISVGWIFFRSYHPKLVHIVLFSDNMKIKCLSVHFNFFLWSFLPHIFCLIVFKVISTMTDLKNKIGNRAFSWR